MFPGFSPICTFVYPSFRVEGSDIYGDGVNVAARLEGLAEPGGICVSGTVFDHVKGKVAVEFADLGEQQVKNIDRPIRVYRVLLDGGPEGEQRDPPSAAAAAPLELPQRPSIAVLPFTVMGGDAEQEYFADGIAEDIITELSREQDLFVIARNSSFAYKGQSPDLRQVGRELGVRYLLEGSVRKAGNRIRLTAQLIEAATNRHLWAERYDRALEDVFALQDELTGTIQNSLLQKVREIDIERALARAPKDLNAYDQMLRAFGLLLKFDRESNREAIREAEVALDLDPDYARAHMILAWAYLYQVFSAWTDAPAEALERGRAAAEKAVVADRNDFWGYAALGFAELFSHRPARALAALDRAVELNPNGADVHMMRGQVLNFLGRPEEGLVEAQLAMRHNPHYPHWYLLGITRAYYMLGRFEEAIPLAERLVTATPDVAVARLGLIAIYVASGRAAVAQAEMATCLAHHPDLTAGKVAKIIPFQQEADLARYLDLLRRAGLPEE